MESTSSVSQKEKDYNGFKDRAYKCSVPKYSFYRLGNWGPKKSDSPTKSVWTQNKKCFPTCSRKSKNNREMIERALGDLQYLLQAHLCQRNLGAAPPGKEEHRTHRSSAIVKGKGRVQVQQGLYSSDCPLVPHQCPLLPTTGENCQNLEREGSNQKSNS